MRSAEEMEKAHLVIMAATKLLDELVNDDCAPCLGDHINSPFIKAGLVEAIRMAADSMMENTGQ